MTVIFNVVGGGGGALHYSRHICFLTTTEEEFDVSYGYVSYGETVHLSDVFTMDYVSRIQSLRVTITGDGAETAVISADGWTVTRETGLVTMTHNVESMGQAVQAIGLISVTGDGATPEVQIDAEIQVTAITDEGEEIPADGSTRLWVFYGVNWEILESNVHQWSDLDGMTWRELETSGKNW